MRRDRSDARFFSTLCANDGYVVGAAHRKPPGSPAADILAAGPVRPSGGGDSLSPSPEGAESRRPPGLAVPRPGVAPPGPTRQAYFTPAGIGTVVLSLMISISGS